MILACFFIIRLRRPTQFLSAGIWAETGVIILPDYIAEGAKSLFLPVQGYLNVAARLVNIGAFKISFFYYPEVSVLLTLLFTLGVLLAIIFSPTHLRLRPLCALVAVMVPTNPEAFAVPLYVFWWSSLLLFLVLVWREEAGGVGWRAFYLLLGGLSSPLIVPLAALVALRAWFSRRKAETGLALLAITLAGIQAGVLFFTKQGSTLVTQFGLGYFYEIIRRFFGLYLGAHWVSGHHLFWAGLLLLTALFFFSYRYRHRFEGTYFLLLACIPVTIFLSTIRVSVNVLDLQMGARYFFLPFILTSWILLWQLDTLPGRLRMLPLMFLCLSVIQGLPYFVRRHEVMDWRGSLQSCIGQAEYRMPVYTDGELKNNWSVWLRGEDCRRLMQESWVR